jgi:DNA repair protein RadC
MYATNRVLKVMESDTANAFEAVKIANSRMSADFIRQFYLDDLEIFESFFIVLLNRQNMTIGWAKISQGGVAGTVVDPIVVAKYAVDTLSSSVILAHNHPSGNLNPSQADKDLTKRITKGLELFGIRVLDHIILTKDSYLSMQDEGLM